MAARDLVLDIFKERNALLTGHFKLASGLHSDKYFQCTKIFENPIHGQELASRLAKMWSGTKIDVVAGPAYGGIIISYELARILGTRAVFLEKVEGNFALRRGFAICKGDKVLIAEDVITTGSSSYQVVETIKGLGAEVIGTTCLIFRGDDYKGALKYLAKVTATTWQPPDCPLCKQDIPLETPGQSRTR